MKPLFSSPTLSTLPVHQQAMLNWFSELSPTSLENIHHFYDEFAYFKDPFNEVNDRDSIQHIFTHMFKTTINPRFEILEVCSEDALLFVTWNFHFQLKNKMLMIHGATKFRFNKQNLITEHRDYWDASEEFFQQLPLIGKLIAFLRKQCRV